MDGPGSRETGIRTVADSGQLIFFRRLIEFGLRQSFSGADSWLRNHGSVVLLALFLLVLADIMIRRVPTSLLVEWNFWTLVSGWILILLLGGYVSHRYLRIKRSTRIVIYLSTVAVAIVFIVVGFILGISELFWSPIVGMFSVFSVTQLYEVIQNLHRSMMFPQINNSPEDHAILGKAQETSRKLGLSERFNPLYLTWVPNISSDEVSFEDEFQKRNLLLPQPLRGKLNPEELNVIVAAFLMSQKSELATTGKLYAKALLPVAVYGIAFIEEIPAIVKIPYAALAGELGYLVIATVSMTFLFAQIKKQALANDKLTAQLVGKEALLGVFRKIAGLNLHDLELQSTENGLKARVRRAFKPTIQERIGNLASV